MIGALIAVMLAGAMGTPSSWDWNIVVGAGQSLSVGGGGLPVQPGEQPFGNLKVSSGNLHWPVNPDDPKVALEPLIEPVGRRSAGYPSSWPQNIDGTTYHTSAANEVSHLSKQELKRDYVTVHMEVGEAGQGMVRIRKESIHEGVTGRAYEASLVQTKAIARLARTAGKSFGGGAIFMTHGETDTGNANYEEELFRLWSDYNADLKSISGQNSDVTMIVSQHNRLGDRSPSTIAQWKVGVDHPENIVCSGPKYQYPYGPDALHLSALGYQLLGEKYGQVYFERVVRGHRWRPLEPEHISRKGASVTIRFHVPTGPLVWDTTLGEPHPSSSEWSKGRGFEVTNADGKRIEIRSATIRGADSVVLELAAEPGPGARLGYATFGEPTLQKPPFNASPHWGLLRDSDPFVGFTTHTAQPNFCVAFETPLP